MNDRRLERWIFLAFLVVRLAFIGVSAKLDLDLDRDSILYDEQSTGILERGDFDFQALQFTMAPLYSCYQALHKLVFGAYWKWSLGIVQLLLCAYSGVILYRLARRLFDHRTALVTAVVYCFFPLTLVWVNTFAQDMPFQLNLIFFLYVLHVALEKDSLKWTAFAASLFAITFLTKSHILLFAPFVPLIMWFNMPGTAGRRIGHAALFAVISLAFTLPYGLYQYNKHGQYVLSSTGQGGHLLWGHNEDTYRFIVDPPPLGSDEHRRILNMDFMVVRELKDTLATVGVKERQTIFMDAAMKWCHENPDKARKLALYDLWYFLFPGVNYHLYSFTNWLVTFLMSLPIYALGYVGIYRALKANWRRHLYLIGLIVCMLVFSVGFFVQNRFRTITLEPYYIMYASAMAVWIWERYRSRNSSSHVGPSGQVNPSAAGR
jgi:4-amino-4-deoxy-L-arabinose transferase-like glycosyltransferase